MRTRKTVIILIVAMLSVLLCGIAMAEDSIRIGMPAALTGPYAHDGLVCKQAVAFAVESINAQGGVLGKKLEFFPYDVEDVMPEKVMASAQDLVMGKKVNMVITTWVDYGVDVKAYGRFDVPYLSGAASSLSIEAYQENPDKYWNFFEYEPSEAGYSSEGWKDMMALPYQYPNQKVFIISEDDHWSHVIADTYEASAKKDGWEVVGKETVNTGNVEWGGILTKIRASNPSIIMMITLSPKAEAAFVNQFMTNPTQSLLHFPYTPSAPEFKEMAGKNGNGVFWNQLVAILPGEKQEAFKQKYIEKYGEEYWSITYPAAIWDMMHFWKQAVEKVGKVDDYKAICDYMENTPYEGLCGTYNFPKATHTVLNGADKCPAVFYQIQDGKDVLLSPENLALGKFQAPAWIK